MRSWSFKPYYKWITFNILGAPHFSQVTKPIVLNLIINGLLSIFKELGVEIKNASIVLNLIINGLLSILSEGKMNIKIESFEF